MRIEPTLDTSRLRALLRSGYGLAIDEVTFVPFGIDSWCYVADGRDGSRAFVKLLRRPSATAVADSEMPLLAALAARRIPVPRPIARLDGSFLTAFDGYEVQVFEYIAGHNLEDESAWPDELYGRVAALVASVHASTGGFCPLVQRREDFELHFLRPLVETLALLEAGRDLPAGDDPTLARLREVVVPRAGELSAAIGRLEELRDLARQRASDEVLCHTDIWGSNLILSDDGTLYLLDWNGALLGPPERDLFMFAGTVFFPADRFGWFLKRYESAFRPVRVDPRMFGFYFYRRNLEDLAGFVGSIVEGRLDVLDRTEARALIERLLASLPRLEGRIAQVAEVLHRAGRG